MRYATIGGQAVIEGVMMRNGNDYAVAVRKSVYWPECQMAYEEDPDYQGCAVIY